MFTILIVDGSTTFRELLRESLTARFPFIRVDEAPDAKTGIEKVGTSHSHLIFLDIHLPDENGLDLTRRIKHLCPASTVVVFTTYDLPEYRIAAFQAGADHFASKDSWSGEEINRLVDIEMITRKKEQTLQFDDIPLNRNVMINSPTIDQKPVSK